MLNIQKNNFETSIKRCSRYVYNVSIQNKRHEQWTNIINIYAFKVQYK